MSTWRPLPGVAKKAAPKGIVDALDKEARRLGAPGADALRVVFGRWAEIVGEETARHCRPLRLSAGTLVVGVGDPARATELRYRGREILDRVEAVTGDPVAERLEVRVRARR